MSLTNLGSGVNDLSIRGKTVPKEHLGKYFDYKASKAAARANIIQTSPHLIQQGMSMSTKAFMLIVVMVLVIVSFSAVEELGTFIAPYWYYWVGGAFLFILIWLKRR